jgi:hypothetical protein
MVEMDTAKCCRSDRIRINNTDILPYPNPLLSRFLNSGFANGRKQVDVDWLKVTSH